MKRYLLTISYNGTNYSGWQSQNNATTVQSVIEESIKQITSINVKLFASGRTDAGVHAVNQKAHFDIDSELDLVKFKKSINAVLPKDIVVKDISEVFLDFHARFNVKKKTYAYHINIGDRDVFCDDTELHFPKKLDIEKMKLAAKEFVGTYDFQAFCSSNTEVEDFVRTIYSLNIEENNNKLVIYISGSGFLYNMVRIIVGTLLDVGQGKKQVEDIKNIITSKNRALAGKTVSAKGLFLFNVEY